MSSRSGGSVRTRQATAQTTRQVFQERGAEATRTLREVFQLPVTPSDATILGTALAEVAAEEGRHNPGFVRAVRSRYDELVGLRGTSATRAAHGAREALPPLVPLHRDPNHRIDTFAPPDPQFLTRVYGREQLGRALQEYTLDMLKRAAANVEAAHPGTRPTSRTRKDAVIAYIVQHSGDEA